MATAVICKKKIKGSKVKKVIDSKKISKAGLWMKNNPKGIGKIIDMKAVLE